MGECADLIDKAVATDDEIASWMTYPMESESIDDKKSMETIVNLALHSLSISGSWIFQDFLTEYGLQHFKESFRDIPVWTQKSAFAQTIFQDMGDSKYSENHTRNGLNAVCSHTFVIPKYLNPDPFKSLYEYPPLLSLLNKITIRSKRNTRVFLSPDLIGKYYTAMYNLSSAEEINDGQAYQWHYDIHPFTCILMLQNDPHSGIFEYTSLPPPFLLTNHSMIIDNMFGYESGAQSMAYDDSNEYWSLIRMVLSNAKQGENLKNSIRADEGSMYCFFGNETLHRATSADTHAIQPRVIFAMVYVTDDNFKMPEEFTGFG